MYDISLPEDGAKVLCGNCLGIHEYDLKGKLVEKKFCGQQIPVMNLDAICKNCGKELYVQEVESFNLSEYIASIRINEFINYFKQLLHGDSKQYSTEELVIKIDNAFREFLQKQIDEENEPEVNDA